MLDKLFNSSPAEWKVTAAQTGLELHDLGPINRITLPPDWQLSAERYNHPGQSSLRQYSPKGDTEIRFFFYYRGLPLDTETARSLEITLKRELHVLTPDEIDKLKALLRGKENTKDFEVLSFQSMDLNSRRILVLTGIYTEDQKPMMSLFIDADGSGAIIQEIEYQAPLLSYAEYLPQIEASIQTICWK